MNSTRSCPIPLKTKEWSLVERATVVSIGLAAFVFAGQVFGEDTKGLAIARIERADPVDFNREILPVFQRNCTACHNASKARGDVILESVESIAAEHGELLRALEWVFTGIFTLEYGLRLYCVRKPWAYARSFFGIVDLVAILPAYLGLIFGTSHATHARHARTLR